MEKISPVQIYNGRNIFKYFSLKPRIILLKKKKKPNSSLSEAVASLPY